MSGNGKTLQEVYNEGSQRLDELGSKQRTYLQENAKKSVEELGRMESTIMSKMDKSFSDLDVEINEYLDKAVANIRIAVDSEIDENKKFLDRLQEALRLSCQSLSEDIQALRDSMRNRFEVNADHCLSLQKRHQEKSLGHISMEAARTEAHLKQQARSTEAALNNKANHQIMQLLDKNTKLPSEFFSEFSTLALSIEKRINESVHKLTGQSKEIVAELGSNSKESQSSLDQAVQQLAHDIEQAYKKADGELRKHCEDALSFALLHQEERAKKVCAELFDSQDKDGTGIGDKSTELKSFTSTLLSEIESYLEQQDSEIRKNATEMTDKFENKLKDELDSSKNNNKLVADERQQLLERIAADLSKLEIDFESRLSELSHKCQTKLSTVCSEAELSIISAHDACAADFKSMSSQQRNSIDEKTQDLLSEIERITQTALQAMRSAAGEHGSGGKASQPVNASGSASAQAGDSGSAGGNDDDLFSDFGDLKL